MFESYSDRASRDASRSYELALRAAGGGGISMDAEAILSGGSGNMMQEASDPRQQYARNTGQVFTSIRPIENRIAGQPLHVGRLHRTTPNTRGRSKLWLQKSAAYRGISVPAWLKAAAGGRTEDIEILDQHPVLDAIHKPNRVNVDWALKYQTAGSLELTGWAYWWFPVRNGKKEIWYVPTHWIKWDHSKGLFTNALIRPEGTSQWEPLPPNSIAPFWYPDPGDPLASLAPLEANAMAVVIDDYLRRSQRSAFERGIFPKMAVILGEVPGARGQGPRRPRAKKWQRAQIRAALNQRLRGPDRFGDYAILDSVISKIEKISQSVEEMDFPNSSKMSEGRVARGFGVNPTVTGENEGTNYAQSATAERLFCDLTINPKLDLLGRVMTVWVVPQFDASGDIVLFFEPAKPMDPEQRLREWKVSLDAGGCTLNDYNINVLGLPWREENDVYLRPINRIAYPLGGGSPAAPALPAPQDEGDDEEVTNDDEGDEGETPEESDQEQTVDGEEGEARARPRIKHARSKAAMIESKGIKGEVEVFYENLAIVWLRAHAARSETFTSDLKHWMDRQNDEIVSGLRVSDMPTNDDEAERLARRLLSSIDWTDGMKEVARKHLVHSMMVGAILELDVFGEAPDAPEVVPPAEADRALHVEVKDEMLDLSVDIPQRVISAIDDELGNMLSESYWSDTEETTVRALTNAIKDGIAAGETMREITNRVRGVLGEDAYTRAANIAQTETTGAINAGQHAAREYLVEEEIITGKEWTSNHDQKTRPDHVVMDGQRRKNDRNFDLPDGSHARFPGDRNLPAKQRCRCRCTAIATTAFSDSRMVRLARQKGLARGVRLWGVLHHEDQGKL